MDEFHNAELVPIINACYDFVCQFCKNNPENQGQIFPHINLFMQDLNLRGVRAPEAMSATIENNATLLNKLPDKLLRRFFTGIARYGKIAKFLRFLKVVSTIHGKPFRRNQDLVLKLVQDEKELILELDGNKGAGGTDEEIADILQEEGDETRFSMMMREEYKHSDSFLEYHTECFELLAKCAQGKAVANKIKCQSFMSFDLVLEAILDLELLDRPAGDTRKHSPDALRYIRTALVRFFREVFVNMSDFRTLNEVAAEGNRMYGFGPTPHPKDRWRSQLSLMHHFIQEIELLVKRGKAGKGTVNVSVAKKGKASGVQKVLPETPLEFHYIYVLEGILPCLVDYYGGRHYAFTLRAGNRNSEDCVLVASRLAAAVYMLLQVEKLKSTLYSDFGLG